MGVGACLCTAPGVRLTCKCVSPHGSCERVLEVFGCSLIIPPRRARAGACMGCVEWACIRGAWEWAYGVALGTIQFLLRAEAR